MRVMARRMLAAAVSMTAAASLVTAASAATAAEKSTELRKIGTFHTTTTGEQQEPTRVEMASIGEKCTPITSSPAAARAGAVKECVTVRAKEDAAPRSEEDSSLRLAAATDAACQPGSWTYERFGSCMSDTRVTYTLRDDKGTALGTGSLDIDSSMSLDARSTTWTEQITVTMTGATGAVTHLHVAFDAGCTSACSMANASPWLGLKTFAVGTTATGTVSYTETLASGAVDYLTTNYHMYVTTTGAVPTEPNVNWSNPRKVRCDNAVHQAGSGTPGCVYPDVTPDLSFSIGQYGAAAITYGWALNNLPNMPHSFKRLSDATGQNANRARTCGSQSSVPFIPFDDSVVYQDSCDEFPFAGTYEGGTDGGLCAEIVPQYENGQWFVYQADDNRPVTGQEPCVRGHVPSGDNSAAGGKYGSFVQSQRVIDTEKFTVSITN
ncbi:hypothetical protein [Streptomyces sp. CC210A]|uniref:NucA/NucB deoxyribonuclease domain-containing protein n=1 Tax=Streptomyces sp. CC210A TaxID=2898184 RepID=UPI001F1E64C0|nr:hypothetical protein [Streptomyces sp. CC210A]